ncbi:hypothetical protein ACJRO7_014773 [Eucalyptus globulus]|uniref:non-specific serine/threonine protein kinase n=1 Tax=Eucalyptus globulus TaxID=34317 RepID=A0ABD3L2C4_EUCGL
MEIDKKKILVSDKEIGKGSSGTIVYEGMYEDRRAAVKCLVRGHHDVAMVEIQNLILSDQHENIVRYYGMEEDPKFIYLALEHCICSLDDLIQAHSDSSDNSVFPDDSASMNAYKIKLGSVRDKMQDVELWSADGYPSPQLLKLMSHLHNLGMIHWGIKPQNVLIAKNPSFGAKLYDMGISKCLSKDKSSLGNHATVCGITGWQAPEQLSPGGRKTQKVDMFSLGCVLFFCVARGKHSFGKPIERDFNIDRDIKDLSWVEFMLEAHDLISRLLDQDPYLRPTALEVLDHPFFWSSKMRLTFLHDVGNEVESEEGNSDFLKALANIVQLAFDGNWIEKIDKGLMDDLRLHRRKPYDGSCVGDLLIFVRNVFNQLEKAPERFKVEVHYDISYAYFAGRFPKLLIESYKAVSQSCKKEKLLAGVLSK